jgi:hypothetical protein
MPPLSCCHEKDRKQKQKTPAEEEERTLRNQDMTVFSIQHTDAEGLVLSEEDQHNEYRLLYI